MIVPCRSRMGSETRPVAGGRLLIIDENRMNLEGVEFRGSDYISVFDHAAYQAEWLKTVGKNMGQNDRLVRASHFQRRHGVGRRCRHDQ